MKKISSEKIFIISFIFSITLPLIFFSFFGCFLDWSYFKFFSLHDFLSGEYQENFNDYFKDRLPIYDKIAAIKSSADILTGQVFSNGVFLQDKELIKIDKPLLPDKEYLFTKHVDNFASFYDNKRFYYLIVPSKFQVYGNFLDLHSEHKNYWFLKDYLSRSLNSNFIALDGEVFFENCKEMNFFYRTSNTINSIGAYFLYNKNIKTLGHDPVDIKNFSVFNVVDDYYGELYTKNFSEDVNADTIEVFKCCNKDLKFNVTETYYDGKTSQRDTIYDLSCLDDLDKKHITFGKDAVIKEVETNSEKGENVLIFADDLINNLVQFLAIHFKRMTIVDLHEMFYSKFEVFKKIEEIDVSSYDKIVFIYDFHSLNDDEQFRNLKYF